VGPLFLLYWPSGLAGIITILDFVGVDDERGSVDNCSYETCNATVESSPLTNHLLAVYKPDALFVTSPTASKHWRENI